MTAKDTICAVSTPAGIGGIAVIRVSGPETVGIVKRLWKGRDPEGFASHTAHFGNICDTDGAMIDQAVMTLFRAPNSYTGEDVAEISVHGSLYVQKAVVETLCRCGARLAEPGEFTRRAFTSGRIDLMQAESVADILSAKTARAHRLAIQQLRGGVTKRIEQLREKLINLSALLELELDFSEEEVEFASRDALTQSAAKILAEIDRLLSTYKAGNAIKNGIAIAIVGPTNAGKSSLLNALVGEDRAIVSDIHGTTRDVIEDTLTIDGFTFRIMDTAGLRETTDTIEKMGIERSRKALEDAQIVLYVLDSTCPRPLPDALPSDTIILYNKTDLNAANPNPAPGTTVNRHTVPHITAKTTVNCCETEPATGHTTLAISAKTGQGIDALKALLAERALHLTATPDDAIISNLRQQQSLQSARKAAADTLRSLQANLPTVLTAQSLRATIAHLSELTGKITDQTILTTIFSRFCIGK